MQFGDGCFELTLPAKDPLARFLAFSDIGNSGNGILAGNMSMDNASSIDVSSSHGNGGKVETSGKAGQFRTPRHIIRFMIDLLAPDMVSGEGDGKHLTRIMDPACGTAGFLINTLLHWRVQTSDAKSIRWEWDGTPHHALGGGEFKPEKLGPALTGSDNDRTIYAPWL